MGERDQGPNPAFQAAATRRRFLAGAAAAAAGGFAGAANAATDPRYSMGIALHNVNTGESVRTDFWDGLAFIDEAVAQIDYLLRDWRTGAIGRMDLRLLLTLHHAAKALDCDQPFEVISGFRSESTNLLLHARSPEGVPERSYHMYGMAIDVRLPTRRTIDVRDAAHLAAAGRGGFGYYPGSDFLHIDTGRVPRIW